MQNSCRILLNAEFFGFGPTAAIADFFPYLRPLFKHIGYVGTGCTLDLQRHFPYDDIYDITDSENDFENIVKQYDLFVTALDFSKAEIAVRLGIPTVIYDPLTWYWPKIPDVTQQSLYIAQGFHNVRTRLLTEVPNGILIPPLVPKESSNDMRAIVLLNLGGLQNPFWNETIPLIYARQILAAFKQSITPGTPYIAVASAGIVKGLGSTGTSTFNRQEINSLLPKIKFALKTPGLSNIYDAAAYNIPTLFLPPANDSQGQQLDLIRENGTIDTCLEWSDFFGGKINYKDPQTIVLDQIKEHIIKFQDPIVFEHLVDLMKRKISELENCSHSSTTHLLEKYGRGGAEIMAHILRDYSNDLRKERFQA